MQNHFPLWKNLLILIVFVIGIIYSLPTLYGDDPSVQVSSTQAAKLGQEQQTRSSLKLKVPALLSKALSLKMGEF